ncbi:UvrD-helicase domain-containing protein [Chryseobacterium culicis]|uniref:UvrD/REP helicase N-terminal domain-containing protein n=1 Tax=Chryseobacterium culicis TaxID=680127 RepID=A0A1H6H706_CHRCI|nr:UvrD-helicase domain-containing protein [Chryseobacterium culicis]SEH31571.1 UvrD/REP helicase N-terminal domain-containing protein [Chryseobacterium culicis]
MLQGIDITDDDIQYAERILLPEGKEFDDERKAFIRNLSTIDLQAVPGSGKTTALLAKLLIIERKLPFPDGSGILIISHTNAAIDEIKGKVQKHCPKLFSYPNFIGTIQSFVDEFLAIPFYISTFKKKPNRIDNEIYEETITKNLKFNLRGFTTQEQKNAKYFLIGNNCQFSFRLVYQNAQIKLVSSINGEELPITKPKRGKNWQDFSNVDKNRIREWLVKFKSSIMKKEGTLHFDDAYFLADVYLSKIPLIKVILQKRFSLVFVDEMQDMDIHQYNLLEKVFYDEGNSISIIQRIGDKNQAIYNSVKATDIWEDRADVLRLNGSQRLSKPIADVVKKFALYNDANFNIVGLNECVIKPHILIFENATIGNLIPQFAQIVRTYKEQGSFTNSEKSVKVICWNTDWKDDDASRQDAGKLRLEDYHKGFKKEKSKPKQDYDCLKSYLLFYDKSRQTLGPLRKNILNAFLKILRLENINTSDGRPYTKKKLINFIREKDYQKYEELNLNIYNWSIGVIKGNTSEVFDGVRAYIPNFFAIFSEVALSTSLPFINNDTTGVFEVSTETLEISNHYKEEGLEIEIASVHAVKGQTHCATLYLESYFQGNYESERLTNQFLGNSFDDRRVYHRSSIKMAYVGFSRPTDLLCIAVHKDRFDKYLPGINKEEWEIINVQNDR